MTSPDVTGVSPGEGTGATMSDEEVDDESDCGAYEAGMDPNDSGDFGPLVPTESERTLVERVRQELKYELKQVISAPDPSMGTNMKFSLYSISDGVNLFLSEWVAFNMQASRDLTSISTFNPKISAPLNSLPVGSVLEPGLQSKN